MQPINNLIKLPVFPPEIQARIDQSTAQSSTERLQGECGYLNSRPGTQTGYDCPLCLNRGLVYAVKGDDVIGSKCKCSEIRADMRRFKNSGLSNMLETCTFESFQALEPWQIRMKELAQNFAGMACDTQGKWFCAGGQVGSGKTHLCTAIVGSLLKAGKSARYMLWRDDIVQLKACVNDDVAYNRLIGPLKAVDVLYIDDLFKPVAGKAPTPADLGIAFEILNHRYINKQLITILSSEWSIDNLIEIDEAVGSRIYQRTKEFCLYIPKDRSRNWRLRV